MSDVHNSSSNVATTKSHHNSKSILQLITCPICLEIFHEPLQLPCQHNFCKSCLEQITDDRWSRCPVCRACYRVPSTGIGSFEVNRTILNLLENLACTETRPMLQAKCALCKLDDTITVCEHCREAICWKCRRQHYEEFRKYVSLKLSETQQKAEKLIAKEVENIKNHEENVHHSSQIADTIRSKVNELIDRIKQEEKKLLCNIQEFNNAEQRFYRLIKEKNIQLNNFTKIKTFCLYSQEQLENKEETDQEAIDIRQKCEEYILSINALQNEIFVIKVPRRRISLFNQEMSFDDISLGFVEIGMELEPIESSIQLPSLRKHSTDKEIQHCSKQLIHRLSSTLRNRKHSSRSPISSDGKRNKSPKNVKQTPCIIGKRGTRDTEFIHPSSLAYSKQDQLIYICDTYNNRLVTYEIDGVFRRVHNAIDEMGERRFHYPFAIHIDSNNRLYLIDQSERRIKVFNRDFKLIRLIGQCGVDIGQYLAPCDLCTNEHNHIFVCDAGGHRILKYNEQGQFLFTWGEHGTENGQFKCPACVCILNGSRLAVSDWGNDRIQVFNSDGNHLFSIGHRGKLLGEFLHPLGLIYDETREKLFVCDEGNDRVMIFNNDLSIVELVDSKIGFNGPYDILLLKNGRMIISEHRAHRLQLI